MSDRPTPPEPNHDLVADIIAYEDGELDYEDVLRLFAYLIKTGIVWSLQGRYGRTAADLIEAGVISKEGDVTT